MKPDKPPYQPCLKLLYLYGITTCKYCHKIISIDDKHICAEQPIVEK